eukprot:TRINITY_DN5089_c2_g4_i1.p1 TRINITY_DN5089_c2_g4~~TRINITY_DN5089_c2_g4_i1.p1  ORF type:complete len:2023 (+),score=556.61 TRINITY_DN5089_c2_g4_i1:65-6133(+)
MADPFASQPLPPLGAADAVGDAPEGSEPRTGSHSPVSSKAHSGASNVRSRSSGAASQVSEQLSLWRFGRRPAASGAATTASIIVAAASAVLDFEYIPDVDCGSADFEDGNHSGWVRVFVAPEPGALQYSINGEVQPPALAFEFDGVDTLRFPPTNLEGQWRSGVIRIPREQRIRILGSIRCLARKAGCRHNIPMSVPPLPDVIQNPLRELRDKLVAHQLYQPLEEFDTEVRGKTLVIDKFSVDNALEMRRKRLSELEKKEMEEMEQHKKRMERMVTYESRALKRVRDEAATARQVEAKRFGEARQRRSIVKGNIKKYFFQSGGKVVDFIKTRQSQVLNKYGEMTTTQTEQYDLDKINWDAIPQQLEVHVTSVRGLKNKVPKGEYMVVVSKFNQLGGSTERWSYRDPGSKVPPACPLHDPGDPANDEAREHCEICQGWIGGTTPVVHRATYSDVDLPFDASVHTVLPPREQIKPYNVFIFELVRLPSARERMIAEAEDNSIGARPLTVGWGAFPVIDGFFRVVKGKYKTALVRGPVDMHVEHFKTLENRIKDDIENWVGNLYFEVFPYARECEGRGEFDIEAEFNAKKLDLERYGPPTQTQWEVTAVRRGASRDDLDELAAEMDLLPEHEQAIAAPAHSKRKSFEKRLSKPLSDLGKDTTANAKEKEPPPTTGTRSLARSLASMRYMSTRKSIAVVEKKAAAEAPRTDDGSGLKRKASRMFAEGGGEGLRRAGSTVGGPGAPMARARGSFFGGAGGGGGGGDEDGFLASPTGLHRRASAARPGFFGASGVREAPTSSMASLGMVAAAAGRARRQSGAFGAAGSPQAGRDPQSRMGSLGLIAGLAMKAKRGSVAGSRTPPGSQSMASLGMVAAAAAKSRRQSGVGLHRAASSARPGFFGAAGVRPLAPAPIQTGDDDSPSMGGLGMVATAAARGRRQSGFGEAARRASMSPTKRGSFSPVRASKRGSVSLAAAGMIAARARTPQPGQRSFGWSKMEGVKRVDSFTPGGVPRVDSGVKDTDSDAGSVGSHSPMASPSSILAAKSGPSRLKSALRRGKVGFTGDSAVVVEPPAPPSPTQGNLLSPASYLGSPKTIQSDGTSTVASPVAPARRSRVGFFGTSGRPATPSHGADAGGAGSGLRTASFSGSPTARPQSPAGARIGSVLRQPSFGGGPRGGMKKVLSFTGVDRPGEAVARQASFGGDPRGGMNRIPSFTGVEPPPEESSPQAKAAAMFRQSSFAGGPRGGMVRPPSFLGEKGELTADSPQARAVSMFRQSSFAGGASGGGGGMFRATSFAGGTGEGGESMAGRKASALLRRAGPRASFAGGSRPGTPFPDEEGAGRPRASMAGLATAALGSMRQRQSARGSMFGGAAAAMLGGADGRRQSAMPDGRRPSAVQLAQGMPGLPSERRVSPPPVQRSKSVSFWAHEKRPSKDKAAQEESESSGGSDDRDSNDASSAADSDNELLAEKRGGAIFDEEEGFALFDMIDINQDGILTIDEIADFLTEHPEFKVRLGVDDFDEFFEKLDTNQDGTVDREEFANLYAAQCSGAIALFESLGAKRRGSAPNDRRKTMARMLNAAAERTGGTTALDKVREIARSGKKRRRILVERGEKWAAYTTKVMSEASAESGDSAWAVQLKYCWRAIRDELSLQSPSTFRFWLVQVVFLVSLYAQLYIHGLGQYIAVLMLGIPTSDITPVIYGLLVEYDGNHTYPFQELFIVLFSQCMNIFLVSLIVGVAVAFKVTFGSTPQQCSKFVYCLTIANYVFPFVHLLVDYELDPRKDLAGEWRRHSDILRLIDFYQKNKYESIFGVVTFLVLYANTGAILGVINYMYTMRVHLNGILQDCYWRINVADDHTYFTPFDLEISLREMEWVCEKAERWRGKTGDRRKTMVSLLITTDEEDESYVSKQMHVAIFQISPPEFVGGQSVSARKIYREFYVLETGAVVEARKNRTPIAVNLVLGALNKSEAHEVTRQATASPKAVSPTVEKAPEGVFSKAAAPIVKVGAAIRRLSRAPPKPPATPQE